MLPLEYPPLTLLIFSPALLAPFLYYQVAFALFIALVSVLAYSLLLHYAPRGAALAFALYMLIGAWATAEGRFDLIPAGLTLLCVIAADRKHWTSAYIALAFATLLKIYPLLLLPALFIAEQQGSLRIYLPRKSLTLKTLPTELWHTLRSIRRWHWTNSLIFFAILIAITGLFALIDFRGAVLSQFTYFSNRPVQVEATASTLLWIGTLFGFPVHITFSYGSFNIISALGHRIALLFEILLILGYIYVIWQQWRGKFDLVQASIAVLLLFIATSKVFSPQYLMWLIPLLAYSGAFNRFWLPLWGSICLITTIIYPYIYTSVSNGMLAPSLPSFIELVALRNALIVLVTLAYLFNWFHLRKRKPLPLPLAGKETRPLSIEDNQYINSNVRASK